MRSLVPRFLTALSRLTTLATENIAADAMTRLRREAEKLKISVDDLEIEECPQGGIRSSDLVCTRQVAVLG